VRVADPGRLQARQPRRGAGANARRELPLAVLEARLQRLVGGSAAGALL
jgi:hypothetical protein